MSRKITNPFGDESSDEDDFTNPFAKKKPSAAKSKSSVKEPSSSSTNPFEDSGPSKSTSKGSTSNNNITPVPASGSNSNGGVSNGINGGGGVGRSSVTSKGPVASGAGGGGGNPFESTTTSKSNSNVKPSKSNPKLSLNSNPFDDDFATTNTSNKKSSPSMNINSQQRPEQPLNKQTKKAAGAAALSGSMTTNTNGANTKIKSSPRTSGSNGMNPFDDEPSSNNAPTPLVSQKPVQVQRNKTEKTTNAAAKKSIKKSSTTGSVSAAAATSNNSTNPFEFDAPAETASNNIKSNNNNNSGSTIGVRKKSFFANPTSSNKPTHERSATQPILPTMDQHDDINSVMTGLTGTTGTTNLRSNTTAHINNNNATINAKHKRSVTSVGFETGIKQGGNNNNNTNNASMRNSESTPALSNWLRGGGSGTVTAAQQQQQIKQSKSTSASGSGGSGGFSTPQRKGKSNNSVSLSSSMHNMNTVMNELSSSQHNNNNNNNNNTMNKNGMTTPSPKRKSPKKKKRNYVVQCWPYDNYHNEQKEYYTYLQDRESSIQSATYNNNNNNKSSTPGSPSTPGAVVTPNTNSSKKKRNRISRKKRKEAEAGGGYYSDGEAQHPDDIAKPNALSSRTKSIGGPGTGDNQLFERPQDLPSIKEAVQNLSLFDFENKAEERAVVIVSTWLFDAGLIDELLTNGGSGVNGSSSMMMANPQFLGDNSSILDGQTITSVKSSEGIEVGVHGFPIEGGLKIDKEIEKLRASAQRELTLINTRLNDGVAASGLEVQEMVNAVSATKMDLGRLRELVSYISSGYKKDGFDRSPNNESESIEERIRLSDYPRLKRAINARRNIFRCFRELEFFSQIPLTCDTLREELHAGEWTEHEWNTIRNVCMEHVKLEILLVEAEAGMKTWLDDEDMDDESSMPSLRSNRSLRRHWKGKQAQLASSHYDVVDNFLSQHVKNVWELGDEIRMRILSGIGSAFDLALNNPAGMVALVEAVEVYEHAAEQYKASHSNDDESTSSARNRLQFTNMRAASLAQLYTDFELRGLEVFRAIHMQAADLAEEEDALNSQFNAVMRAATELVTEIDVVKNQMAPCFAPHWRVEMLWSACVAHVCSNQIIQQIGGPDGQTLPDLTVTQLLDLVAWVEFFRETIEDAFPSIGQMHSKKTYFDERPDLFSGDENEVNIENATDILAWTNNMLWDVHRLAQDEFLLRTRKQTEDLLIKVYSANHETYQTSEMRLITSLCEDVFSLVGVHLRTIRERLTKKSDALVLAVCLIFSQLRSKQINSRDKFLKDLDTCCAAANDFQRMSEQCEDVLQDLIDQCEFSEKSKDTLEESCNALVSLYSGDAVFSAQKAHSFIFEPIWENVAGDFFGAQWETEFTHNELALKLTRTLDDFMADLETFLDEFMLKKTVDALVAASVVFYVKCLLLKAESHNSNKTALFQDPLVALERIDKDIKVMKDYFDGLAEGMPALSKVIEKEFHVLTTIEELIRIAIGISETDASDFIIVLHKRLKDVNITKYVVGDIWHLVQPTEERTVWELTESLEQTLLAVCPPDNSKIANDRMNVPGLRLDESLALHYIQSKRKRPVVAGAVEKMMTSMKKNWVAVDEKMDQL